MYRSYFRQLNAINVSIMYRMANIERIRKRFMCTGSNYDDQITWFFSSIAWKQIIDDVMQQSVQRTKVSFLERDIL